VLSYEVFATFSKFLSERSTLSWNPLVLEDIERRLRLSLTYYAFFRPHQGLGGATPTEVYHRVPPAHLTAVQIPRGQLGEPSDDMRLEIAFFDKEKTLPVLIPKAA
jgi:hypothetical protein